MLINCIIYGCMVFKMYSSLICLLIFILISVMEDIIGSIRIVWDFIKKILKKCIKYK